MRRPQSFTIRSRSSYSIQREKRERLQRACISAPENVTFAPIDFETTSLAAGLLAGGFDPSTLVGGLHLEV
jgi:hypothetical protein